jgi:hypothetical protein
MQPASEDVSDPAGPTSGEVEAGPQVDTCGELTALPVGPLAEGALAAAPAPETVALNDRLFQPGRAGPPSEDGLFLAFPGEGVDVVVGLEGVFAGVGRGKAVAPSEPVTHPDDPGVCLDGDVVTVSGTATVGPGVATPSTARPEVESLKVKGEQPVEAREEETAAEVAADEVIEEMLLAVAVDELVGDVVVAFAEEAGGDETEDAPVGAADPLGLLGPHKSRDGQKKWKS